MFLRWYVFEIARDFPKCCWIRLRSTRMGPTVTAREQATKSNLHSARLNLNRTLLLRDGARLKIKRGYTRLQPTLQPCCIAHFSTSVLIDYTVCWPFHSFMSTHSFSAACARCRCPLPSPNGRLHHCNLWKASLALNLDSRLAVRQAPKRTEP